MFCGLNGRTLKSPPQAGPRQPGDQQRLADAGPGALQHDGAGGGAANYSGCPVPNSPASGTAAPGRAVTSSTASGPGGLRLDPQRRSAGKGSRWTRTCPRLQVNQPVLGYAVPGIKRRLHVPVPGQRGVGHLDEQEHVRRAGQGGLCSGPRVDEAAPGRAAAPSGVASRTGPCTDTTARVAHGVRAATWSKQQHGGESEGAPMADMVTMTPSISSVRSSADRMPASAIRW